jgi:glutathione peroxidase
MKYIMIILILVLLSSSFAFAFFGKKDKSLDLTDKSKSIYDYSINLIDGKEQLMEKYKGKKILFVNVASKCGYTPQYQGLQELYEKYNDKIEIIGFPANDFLWQEPAKNDEIKSFCSVNYGVTFPIIEKTVVKKSKDQHPIYTWLSHSDLNGWNDSAPGWNFYKYLVDENGKLIEIFPSKIKPLDSEIVDLLK